jgi:hypothetical protein
MVDPRLNDRGFSEPYREQLAYRAGLIPADHPQLWKDSDLHRAAARPKVERRSANPWLNTPSRHRRED